MSLSKKSILGFFVFIVSAAALIAQGGTDKGASVSSNFNEKGYPIVKEPLTLTFATGQNILKFNDLEFFKEQEAATNVKINWIFVSAADWQQKKSLMFASAELPDAFYGGYSLTDQEVLKYGPDGALVPLNSLIDKYADNFKAVMAKRPQYKGIITAPDGKIYALPQINERAVTTNTSLAINKTWLDKIGKPIPTTTEEFYNVLKAFKAAGDINGNGKADEWPFSFGDYKLNSMFGSFGLWDAPGHMLVKGKDVVYTAMRTEYKDALVFFNRLAAEKLVHPESFVLDGATHRALLTSKPTVFGGLNAWLLEARFGNNERGDFTYMKPLKGPTGAQMWKKDDWGIHGKAAFAITSKNKYPEVTMRWIDRIIEPKKSFESFWGTLGHNYEKNADGTWKELMAPAGMPFGDWIYLVSPYSAGYQIILSDAYKTFALPSADKLKYEINREYYDESLKDDYQNYPKLYFTVQESDELAKLSTDINTYVEEMYARWLMIGGIQNEWDGYLSKLKAMGIDRYIKIYQDAYTRYLSSAK